MNDPHIETGAAILVVVGTVVVALCTVARKWLEMEDCMRHEREMGDGRR